MRTVLLALSLLLFAGCDPHGNQFSKLKVNHSGAETLSTDSGCDEGLSVLVQVAGHDRQSPAIEPGNSWEYGLYQGKQALDFTLTAQCLSSKGSSTAKVKMRLPGKDDESASWKGIEVLPPQVDRSNCLHKDPKLPCVLADASAVLQL